MITFEDDDKKLEIELIGVTGSVVYRLNGNAISREDYLAILESIQTSALADIAFALDPDQKEGGLSKLVDKLDDIRRKMP